MAWNIRGHADAAIGCRGKGLPGWAIVAIVVGVIAFACCCGTTIVLIGEACPSAAPQIDTIAN